MSGAAEAISAEERAKIEELRKSVRLELTPYYATDFNLLRWLKGHNNRMEEVVPKLRNHLLLRRSTTFQLDTLPDGPRDHPVHRYWQAGLTGEAGPQTPNTLVNVEQTGTNDYWGLLHSFPLNEIIKARVYDLETMLREVMKMEERSGQQWSVLYVMDLSGLKYDKNLMTLMTGALASISNFMSEHYVELVHTFVLVNAPSFISTIWTIASPLLPERTRQKVKILGASSWRRDVLALARPEVLPSYWNDDKGDAKPAEAAFKARVDKSIPVEKHLHRSGERMEPAEILYVPAGRTGSVEVRAEIGQWIEWRFEVGHITTTLLYTNKSDKSKTQIDKIQTNGHFGYALYLRGSEAEEDPSKMELIYPRFNKVPGPTYVPINDRVQCQKSGCYKLWFSNQHAWFHTLNVRHQLTVSDGDDAKDGEK